MEQNKHGDIRAVNHQPTINKSNQEKHILYSLEITPPLFAG